MNKFTKVLLAGVLTFFYTVGQSQDNPTSIREISNTDPLAVTKKLNMRIYGGPEMAFCYAGDYSEMKGGKLGMNGGFELNKNLGKKSYGIIGLGFTSGGYDRWINDDPTVASKTAFDQLTTLELPIGIGFNLGKEAPRGFFVNFNMINSLMLHSESNFTVVPFGDLEVTSNSVNNTYDNFNLGAKVELGTKVKFEGNSYSAFSVSAKTMFYNRFSTNTNQFTGLNLAALMSFYF